MIFSNVTYIAVYRLLNELFNHKFQVETTILDTSDPENVRAAMRQNTKLIHIETPGNPIPAMRRREGRWRPASAG